MGVSGKKDKMSKAELQQRSEAAVTHGLYTDGRQRRIIDLRQQIATHPGRIELQQELAAELAYLLSAGTQYLSTKQGAVHLQKGGGPLGYMSWCYGHLIRMLRDWPDPADSAVPLEAVLKETEERLAEVEQDA